MRLSQVTRAARGPVRRHAAHHHHHHHGGVLRVLPAAAARRSLSHAAEGGEESRRVGRLSKHARSPSPAVGVVPYTRRCFSSAASSDAPERVPLLSKVLVANRGEIACRVIQTAKRLNVETVAVFSEADEKSMHASMADESYCVGPPASRDSYLRSDRLFEICRQTGATAIHPGYGFLSENAEFARECEANGIAFVGPPASAIEAMGSKSASKDIMAAAGVALVPGYHDTSDQSPERLQQEAVKIGFPVLIKAVLGGGGKGMRIVRDAASFQESLDSAKAEAMASFKDDKVLVEKYIDRPRHVEVQVFADTHGNVVSLSERDCSVQRRHQKVIEEAPAPNLKPGLSERLGKAARDAARAVGYVGAGTVEFIMDVETQDFWFMEMNTRLQVEHPVTEMVTGTDLVEWQLRIASGDKLPMTQEEVNARLRGWSFEARVYAENPRNNFLPGTGKIVHMSTPAATFSAGDAVSGSDEMPASGVRVDTGVREGDDVSVFYDPMIAKLVTWDVDRDSALRRMRRALENWHVVGLHTNVEFLHALASHPAFVAGDVETGFIDEHYDALLPPIDPSEEQDFDILAAVAVAELRKQHLLREDSRKAAAGAGTGAWADPWSAEASSQTGGFRLNSTLAREIKLLRDEEEVNVSVKQASPNEMSLTLPSGDTVGVRAATLGVEDDETRLSLQLVEKFPADRESSSAPLGRRIDCRVVHHDDAVHIFRGNKVRQYQLPVMTFGAGAAGGAGSLLSPMPGKITQILVKVGDHVEAGDTLLKMEAMKMEHTIRAPVSGTVDEIRYVVDDIVEEKKQLASITPDDAE